MSQLRIIATDVETSRVILFKFWNQNLTSSFLNFTKSEEIDKYQRYSYYFNFSNKEKFPKERWNESLPPEAKFNILLFVKAYQLPYCTNRGINYPFLKYKTNDDTKTKISYHPSPSYRTVSAKGAWISSSFSGTILILLLFQKIL